MTWWERLSADERRKGVVDRLEAIDKSLAAAEGRVGSLRRQVGELLELVRSGAQGEPEPEPADPEPEQPQLEGA